MKKPNMGMLVSSAAHVAVIGYAVVGFTHAKPFDRAPDSMAVEVLTASEFDKLTKGDKTSKTVDKTPKVAAKKIAAATPEPKPVAPEKRENVEARPAPPPPVKTEPPKPKPPEPKKAETPPPPPPTPQPKPAELPKPPVKKQEVAKVEDPIAKQLEKKPEPKPQPKAEPKKVEKKSEPPKPAFDPTKIASLIDKRDPGRVAQAAPQASDVNTAGIANGNASQLALTRSSMIGNMIREQLYNCWMPPAGIEGARDLYATISFDLTPDGVLMGSPRLQGGSPHPAYQSFAESAMRAVHSCTQPTRPLRLPRDDYNIWKNVTLDFIMPET